MDDSRKRKRTFESRPNAPLRGVGFTSGIQDLAYGGEVPVLGALNIPYQETHTTRYVRPSMAPNVVTSAKRVDDHGTFGLTSHRDDKGYWSQGLLMPMGKTSYFDKGLSVDKAIPSDLTVKRARVESRAMKFLSLRGTDYTPKGGDIGVTIVEQRQPKGAKPVITRSDHDVDYWGGLTMGSFLEDITGSRSMGIHDVGSGMRAMTMASKWRMKNSGATSDVGFGARMLEAFPQLGKKDIEKAIIPGLGTHETGASALRQHIVGDDPARRMAVVKHHVGLKGSVFAAHHAAETAAAERFDAKLAMANSTAPGVDLTPVLGKWWEAQRVKGTDFSADPSALQKTYVANKFGRHAIEKYPDLSQLDAIKALKTTNRAEYTRQKRDFLTTNLKGSPHLQEMQDRWFAKDHFEAKLADGRSRGATPAGKWWGAKEAGGTDFSALTPGDLKGLKQQYADRRINKLNAGRKFDTKLQGVQSDTLETRGWWDAKKTGGTDFKSLSAVDHTALRKEYIAKKVS